MNDKQEGITDEAVYGDWVKQYIEDNLPDVDIKAMIDKPIKCYYGDLKDLDSSDIHGGDKYGFSDKVWTVINRTNANSFTVIDSDGYVMSHTSLQQIRYLPRLDRLGIVGTTLFHGWLVLDYSDLIDVGSDNRGTPNWKRAVKITGHYDSNFGSYFGMNMNGKGSYISLNNVPDCAIIWQYNTHPFTEYAAINAIGDSVEYHELMNEDQVGEADWENRLLLSCHTLIVEGDSYYLKRPHGRKEQISRDEIDNYCIVKRPLLERKILEGRQHELPELCLTAAGKDFYGCKGKWRNLQCSIGTKAQLFTMQAPKWKVMLYQGNKIVKDSDVTPVILTDYEMKTILKNNNSKVWLRFNVHETFYVTPIVSDDIVALQNNLAECQTFHILIDDPKEQEAFREIILRNVEEAVSPVINRFTNEFQHYHDRYIFCFCFK